MIRFKIIGLLWLILVIVITVGTLLYKYIKISQESYLGLPSFDVGFPQSYSLLISLDNKIQCNALLWDNSIVLISTGESLYFFDINSGRLITKIVLNSKSTGCPTAMEEWIIVPYINGSLQVISKKEFQVIWEDDYESKNFPQSSVSNLILYNKILVVLRYSKHLTAYDIESGNILWETESKNKYMPMSVSDNSLYMSNDKNIYEYNIQTGDEVSTYQFRDRILGEIIFSTSDRLFVEDYQNDDIFLTYDLNRKAVIDEIRLNGINSVKQYIPKKEVLYMIGDDLVVFDTNSKKILWSFEEDEAKLVCLSISANYVFVADSRDTIFMIDQSDGKVKGNMKISLNNICPVATQDKLFIPTNNELIMITLE